MNTRVDRVPRLRRELVVALAVKFAAIFVLWWLFFSHPLDERLTETHIGATIFGASAASSSVPNNSPKHNAEENPR